MGNQNEREAHDEAFQAFRNHNYDTAREIYSKLVESLDNKNKNKKRKAMYCNEYALVLCNGFKDYSEAEKMYKMSLELDPKNATYLGNYGSLLRQLPARLKESESLFEKCLKIAPNDAQFCANYADLLRAVRRYELSRHYFQKSLSINPDKGSVNNNYALLLFSVHEYKHSERYYRKAIDLDPQNNIRHYNLARLLYDTQDWHEAVKLLKIGLDLCNERHCNSYWLLGRIYMDMDRFDKAMDALQTAIKMDPTQILYICDYALCLVQMGRFEKVQKVIDRAKKINDRYLYAYAIQAHALSKVGRVKGADEIFEQLSDNYPEDVVTSPNSRANFYYFYALHLHYIKQNYRQATKFYKQLCGKMRPKMALAHYHYATCLFTYFKVRNGEISQRSLLEFVVDPPSANGNGYGDERSMSVQNSADVDEKEMSKSPEILSCDMTGNQYMKLALKHLRKAKSLNPELPCIIKNYPSLKKQLIDAVTAHSQWGTTMTTDTSDMDTPKGGKQLAINVFGTPVASDREDAAKPKVSLATRAGRSLSTPLANVLSSARTKSPVSVATPFEQLDEEDSGDDDHIMPFPQMDDNHPSSPGSTKL